jgi:hypothetical protein
MRVGLVRAAALPRRGDQRPGDGAATVSRNRTLGRWAGYALIVGVLLVVVLTVVWLIVAIVEVLT